MPFDCPIKLLNAVHRTCGLPIKAGNDVVAGAIWCTVIDGDGVSVGVAPNAGAAISIRARITLSLQHSLKSVARLSLSLARALAKHLKWGRWSRAARSAVIRGASTSATAW